MQMVLRRAGYDVEIARSGREAIQLLREQAMDVVVTDVLMPERDGIELLMDISGMKRKPKVIAMSGGGRVGVGVCLNMAEGLGAQRVLEKPFPPDVFLKAVEDVLREV